MMSASSPHFSPASYCAATYPSALTALRSVGLLDVLSSTSPGPSVATPCQDGASAASRRNLVRNAG